MTNTMTPSEIAESVDWKAEWELACALRIADRQKSQEIINERDKWIVDLINERDAANDKLKIAEGDRDVARNDCDTMVERMKRYEYELKIATEALESARFILSGSEQMPAEVVALNATMARQGIVAAQVRIKDVG